MTTFQLAVLAPLVGGLLSIGLGGLVAFLADGGTDDASSRLPRILWPVVGFGAIIVLANGLARLGVVIPWSAIVIVALGLGGLWLQRRRLVPSPGDAGLALLAAGPVLAAFSGVIVLAGPTIAGYLIDTNTGVHSAGADWLMRHGGDFTSVPNDTTGHAMVSKFFVGSSYPSGSHALYGLLGALTGTSLTFLSTPLMGFCLAIAALTTMAAARRLGVPNVLSALAGVIVSCGALVFAFGLASEIKEAITLPLLAGLTAFAVDPAGLRRPRAIVVVSAVLGAALYSVLGVAAAAWVVPFVVFVIGRAQVVSAEGRSLLGALRTLGLTAVLGLVLIGPLLPGLADQLSLAGGLSESNTSLAADPGNLSGPIHKVQAFGIWIAPDHRSAPVDGQTTYALLGIGWLIALAGGVALLVERRWSAALWFAGLIVLWNVLTDRGTLWLDSKLVMLSSLVLALAFAKGAAWLASTQARRGLRIALGLALIAPILYGVVRSDVKLYRATTTASEQRYDELAAIDRDYEREGPAYFTEFDEYAMYTLRHVGFIGVGYADEKPHPFVGAAFSYGQSADLDRVPTSELNRFRLIITLRSPLRSSPGTGWTRVRQGRFFDVWRRDPAATAAVLAHVPAGGPKGEPGEASCRAVLRAGRLAQQAGGHLVARVPPAPTVVVQPRAADMTPDWAAAYALSPGVAGDGRLTLTVPRSVRSAEHDLWLRGSVGRPLNIRSAQTGQVLGTLDRLAAGDGSVVGPVRIPAGTRTLLIESTRRQLRPGDRAPTVLLDLAFAPLGQPTLRTVDPADARTLCGQTPEWVEAVRR